MRRIGDWDEPELPLPLPAPRIMIQVGRAAGGLYDKPLDRPEALLGAPTRSNGWKAITPLHHYQ